MRPARSILDTVESDRQSRPLGSAATTRFLTLAWPVRLLIIDAIPFQIHGKQEDVDSAGSLKYTLIGCRWLDNVAGDMMAVKGLRKQSYRRSALPRGQQNIEQLLQVSLMRPSDSDRQPDTDMGLALSEQCLRSQTESPFINASGLLCSPSTDN